MHKTTTTNTRSGQPQRGGPAEAGRGPGGPGGRRGRPARRQPEERVPVPLVPRQVIGRLIKGFREILEASSTRLHLRFHEDDEASTERQATGYILVASRNKIAVTEAVTAVQQLLTDLVDRALQRHRGGGRGRRGGSGRGGGENRGPPRIMIQAPANALQAALEIAMASVSTKKTSKRVNKVSKPAKAKVVKVAASPSVPVATYVAPPPAPLSTNNCWSKPLTTLKSSEPVERKLEKEGFTVLTLPEDFSLPSDSGTQWPMADFNF